MSNTKQRKLSTSQMTLTAIMAAVICILGPLSIPIPVSPVPISFTNLAIYLTVCLLGWKLGTLSYLVYLFIGLIGLPVFSSFSSGVGKLLGPTGGYLIGFIVMSVICGITFEKCSKKYLLVIGLIFGTVIDYIFGTLWLSYEANLTFVQSLWAGVIPYIPGDLIKIIFAVLLGPVIKNRLRSLSLIHI